MPIELDATLPVPSHHPSPGTQAAGKPGTPPPTSGYPFGSDPRPGLSQTVPRPTTPHPRTPQELPTLQGAPQSSKNQGESLPSSNSSQQRSHIRWENLVTELLGLPFRNRACSTKERLVWLCAGEPSGHKTPGTQWPRVLYIPTCIIRSRKLPREEGRRKERNARVYEVRSEAAEGHRLKGCGY